MQHERRRQEPWRAELDEARNDARLASYPPPFPHGWYPLTRTNDVLEAPIRIRAFGEELVLFRRASDGRVAALAAHCPHLGADLGLGRLVDDCIECPFHRWTFNALGEVEGVPYARHIPRAHRTRAYEVEEVHGFVLVYHGPEGVPAPYRPARVAAIDSGELEYRGERDMGIVRMHIVEFSENSADMQHFDVLHRNMVFPFSKRRVPGVEIVHRPSFEIRPDEPHVAWFHDDAHIEVLGRKPKNAGAKASIRMEGPGGYVRFDFQFRDLGRIVLFQCHTPLGPLAQHVRFRWYAAATIPRPVVSYVVGQWIGQWQQDIAIWESKVYVRRPMLVKEDGPVHALRRWYAQFYPAEAVQKPAPVTPT